MERWREWWKEGRVGGLFGGLCQKPHVWYLGIKSDDLDCDTGWQRCSWLLVSPFHHATCRFQRSRATVTQWGLYLMHFKGALFFLTCDLSYKIKGALLLYSKLYVDSTKPNLITNLFNIWSWTHFFFNFKDKLNKQTSDKKYEKDCQYIIKMTFEIFFIFSASFLQIIWFNQV